MAFRPELFSPGHIAGLPQNPNAIRPIVEGLVDVNVGYDDLLLDKVVFQMTGMQQILRSFYQTIAGSEQSLRILPFEGQFPKPNAAEDMKPAHKGTIVGGSIYWIDKDAPWEEDGKKGYQHSRLSLAIVDARWFGLMVASNRSNTYPTDQDVYTFMTTDPRMSPINISTSFRYENLYNWPLINEKKEFFTNPTAVIQLQGFTHMSLHDIYKRFFKKRVDQITKV